MLRFATILLIKGKTGLKIMSLRNEIKWLVMEQFLLFKRFKMANTQYLTFVRLD